MSYALCVLLLKVGIQALYAHFCTSPQRRLLVFRRTARSTTCSLRPNFDSAVYCPDKPLFFSRLAFCLYQHWPRHIFFYLGIFFLLLIRRLIRTAGIVSILISPDWSVFEHSQHCRHLQLSTEVIYTPYWIVNVLTNIVCQISKKKLKFFFSIIVCMILFEKFLIFEKNQAFLIFSQ